MHCLDIDIGVGCVDTRPRIFIHHCRCGDKKPRGSRRRWGFYGGERNAVGFPISRFCAVSKAPSSSSRPPFFSCGSSTKEKRRVKPVS